MINPRDINRDLRTNLNERDYAEYRRVLAEKIFLLCIDRNVLNGPENKIDTAHAKPLAEIAVIFATELLESHLTAPVPQINYHA